MFPRRNVDMFQRNIVWMFHTSSVRLFHDKLVSLFQDRNVTMFLGNIVLMFHEKPVDPTPDRSVNPSPSNIVNLSQTRVAKLSRKKSVTKSATMFIGASFVFDIDPTVNWNSSLNIESRTLTSLPNFCTLTTKIYNWKIFLCLKIDNICWWQSSFYQFHGQHAPIFGVQVLAFTVDPESHKMIYWVF